MLRGNDGKIGGVRGHEILRVNAPVDRKWGHIWGHKSRPNVLMIVRSDS